MVDEAFPFHIPTAEEAQAMTPASRMVMKDAMMDQLPAAAELDALPGAVERCLGAKAMTFAAEVPDAAMRERLPLGPQLEIVSSGRLEDADSVHRGSGTATLYTGAGAGVVLRLEEFRITNGPDLHVLLATGESPRRRSDLGDYVDLGSLKGNVGDQNYSLPADLDHRRYLSVVIYCKPFHVVFATAMLQAP